MLSVDLPGVEYESEYKNRERIESYRVYSNT